MRVFTRTEKVLGVSPYEAKQLLELVQEAQRAGKASTQIGANQLLVVEIGEGYAQHEARKV